MASKAARARSRSRQMTVPLAVIAGMVPLTLNVYNGAKNGGINGAGFELVRGLTGYNWQAGKMEFNALVRGVGPILLGFLAHKVAGRLGVNRALAQAGVPFVRI
jgi:hypothetical protein